MGKMRTGAAIAVALWMGFGLSPAVASSGRDQMIRKLDMMDKLEVQELVAAAQKCAQAENFACAREKLQAALRHVVDDKDRGWITKNSEWVEQVALEAQQRREAEARRRRDEEERARASAASSSYQMESCRTSPGDGYTLLQCTFRAGSSSQVSVWGTYFADPGTYFSRGNTTRVKCDKGGGFVDGQASSLQEAINFIASNCRP